MTGAADPLGTPGEQRLALVALAAGTLGLATVLLVPVAVVGPVLSVVVAPGLVAVAGLRLLHRRGVLGRSAAVRSGVLTAAALLCAAAATGWTTGGFDEGGGGSEQGGSSGAWFPLLLTGWALGTAAVAPALMPLFGDVRRRVLRAVLASWVGAVIAVALGVALLAPGFAPLAALGMLFLLTWTRRPRAEPQEGPGRPWPMRRVRALVLISLTAGSAALALALTGSWWPGFRGDGTAAMNLGLTLGGPAMLPLLVAGGAALRSRSRHRRSAAPALAVAAVLTGSAAQAVGAGAPRQELLVDLAGLLTGAAAALVLLPLLPHFGRWHPVVMVAMTVALAVVGFPLVVVGPILAPFVAATVLIVLRRRTRRTGGSVLGLEPSD